MFICYLHKIHFNMFIFSAACEVISIGFMVLMKQNDYENCWNLICKEDSCLKCTNQGTISCWSLICPSLEPFVNINDCINTCSCIVRNKTRIHTRLSQLRYLIL